VVRQAVNRGWVDLPLRELLFDRYHCPVYVANDSHMMALAEYTFGRLGQTANLVVVKISEGIGAGIVIGGRLYCGDGFGAGEIGHFSVVEDGERCSCGNLGCLETVASVRAIVRHANVIAEEHPDSLLARRAAAEGISLATVAWAFHAGDPLVRELVRAAARYLGVAIAGLISLLNIHEVILTGEFVEFGDFVLEEVRKEVTRRVLPRMATETHIAFSTLGSDAMFLGTSALVLAEELGVP